MRGVGGRTKPWAEILCSLRRGDMPARALSGDGPLPSRLFLSASLVKEIRSLGDADRRWDRLINRGDALEILNISLNKSAALRAWHASDGDEILEGRLIDLARSVISPLEVEARWGIPFKTSAAMARRAEPALTYSSFGWERAGFEAMVRQLSPDPGDPAA
jgi:hypothetical protein